MKEGMKNHPSLDGAVVAAIVRDEGSRTGRDLKGGMLLLWRDSCDMKTAAKNHAADTRAAAVPVIRVK